MLLSLGQHAHLSKAYGLLLLWLECMSYLLRSVEKGSGLVMSPRNASPSWLARRLYDCNRRSCKGETAKKDGGGLICEYNNVNNRHKQILKETGSK